MTPHPSYYPPSLIFDPYPGTGIPPRNGNPFTGPNIAAFISSTAKGGVHDGCVVIQHRSSHTVGQHPFTQDGDAEPKGLSRDTESIDLYRNALPGDLCRNTVLIGRSRNAPPSDLTRETELIDWCRALSWAGISSPYRDAEHSLACAVKTIACQFHLSPDPERKTRLFSSSRVTNGMWYELFP